MELKDVLRQNLMFLRKQKNLTMDRIADVINLSRQAYAAYEYGTREMSIESLKLIADFYGITMDLMVSSALIDGRQPQISFSTLTYEDAKLQFSDISLSIKNTNSSVIVVKLDDLNFKLFESTITHIPDHEQLIEFKGNYHCAKVYFFDDGSGCFYENGKMTRFTKLNRKSLVIIGMLMATIKKEYELDYFL